MKSPEDVAGKVAARVKDTWAATVLAQVHQEAPWSVRQVAAGGPLVAGDELKAAASWPHTFALGRKASSQIAGNFAEHVRSVHAWRDWARVNNVELVEERRLVAGTQQQAVTHVIVPDLDAAAAIAGPEWGPRITEGRARARHLMSVFPTAFADARAGAALLRDVVRLSELDFDILCGVADWFARTPAGERAGLTPRQVPIEGVHAKWLDTNQKLVRSLAGLEDLALAPAHPSRVHFTYLDPDHLAGGGRRHDSFSVGDTVSLPYRPSVVVISENKDTAVGFPPLPGGVAVEGAGAGGGTIAQLEWVRDADAVVYWGDMDAEGLEILNEFRAKGVPAVSIFMNLDTYDTYRRYGTNHDRHGKALKVRAPKPVGHLTATEDALYRHLTSGQATVLRVEQERIPLKVALTEVKKIAAAAAVPE